jgi:D-alanyl-D-alanine dipeptidase
MLSTSAAASAKELPPADFVDVATVVPHLSVDVRYAGDHNFVGEPIDGYERAVCLLTQRAASALALVQDDLRQHALGLKVFDCYRPRRAVAHFMRWAKDPADVRRKAEFYPNVDKRDLFRLGYIASHSGHSRGSTVDLTLVSADGNELDMGTSFDLLGPESWPSSTAVSASARRHRALLAAAMRRRGFTPYAKEWWHFTLAQEPYPNRYFDFPVR